MKRVMIALLAAFAVIGAVRGNPPGVKIGDAITTSGARLSVPVMVENIRSAAVIHVYVTYDPLVLTPEKVEPGTLKDVFKEFDYIANKNSIELVVSSSENHDVAEGSVANLTFMVRAGSEDLYSDITISDFNIHEKTMTADLMAAQVPVVKSGMLRIVRRASLENTVPMEFDGGGVLSGASRNKLAKMLPLSGTEGAKVVVQGSPELVNTVLDLGITPFSVIENGVTKVNVGVPELRIIEFDPQKQVIRVKVTPTGGGILTSAKDVSGVVHVYGCRSLAERMTRIDSVKVDLSDYLGKETEGEIELKVELGDYKFFKVGAYCE